MRATIQRKIVSPNVPRWLSVRLSQLTVVAGGKREDGSRGGWAGPDRYSTYRVWLMWLNAPGAGRETEACDAGNDSR